MTDIRTEFLFDMRVDFDRGKILNVGRTPYGNRRIIYAAGGWIEGPKIKAAVLPGGGDWILVRPDGVGVLDVRVAARTDDGHILYIYYRGCLIIRPEQLKRIDAGEDVDPSEYYFRATPVFETASEKYAWLNGIVAVATGRVLPDGVVYKVYAVL